MAEDRDNQDAESKEIGVYYERAPMFRTIHADGAWAGITPRLEIQFSVFTDLRPMPDYYLHKISPEGGLGEIVGRTEKKGIIREMEVSIVMTPENTTNLITILNQMLEQVEKAKAELEKAKETKVK